MISCIGVNRQWEEVESDYDHVLNVFGILNLDPGYSSFIGLYRTTNLNEVSQKFSRVARAMGVKKTITAGVKMKTVIGL